MQLLALTTYQARRWEPKRLRLSLFPSPGNWSPTARRRTLRLSAHAPWTHRAFDVFTTLRA